MRAAGNVTLANVFARLGVRDESTNAQKHERCLLCTLAICRRFFVLEVARRQEGVIALVNFYGVAVFCQGRLRLF